MGDASRFLPLTHLLDAVLLTLAGQQGLIRDGRSQQEARRRFSGISALGRRVLEAEAERMARQLRDTRAVTQRPAGRKAT